MNSDPGPSNTDESETSAPDDKIKELMAEMEPETRELVSSFLAIQQRVGPVPSSMLTQINKQHMEKYLEIVQKSVDQSHEFRLGELELRKSTQNLHKSNRLYYLLYFLVTVAVLSLAVAYLLPNHQDFLSQILQILVAFAGGIGVGHSLKSRK